MVLCRCWPVVSRWRWRSAQQRAVLAMVMLEVGGPVSRDRLVDGLWGERPPATAAHAVQVYVSGIRKVLRAAGDRRWAGGFPAGTCWRSTPSRSTPGGLSGWSAMVSAYWLRIRRGRGSVCGGVGLWRGPPLADLSSLSSPRVRPDGWRSCTRPRSRAGRVAAVRGARRRDRLITALVAANPLRERPRWLLMVALYRAGAACRGAGRLPGRVRGA